MAVVTSRATSRDVRVFSRGPLVKVLHLTTWKRAPKCMQVFIEKILAQ